VIVSSHLGFSLSGFLTGLASAQAMPVVMIKCNHPTSVRTFVSTTKYRIRENHPDATTKDHIVKIPQSSGFLAIKVKANI